MVMWGVNRFFLRISGCSPAQIPTQGSAPRAESPGIDFTESFLEGSQGVLSKFYSLSQQSNTLTITSLSSSYNQNTGIH